MVAPADIWCNPNILFRSNDSKPVLSDELKAKIRSWNRADSALFDAVNSTFWSKIEKFGFEKMETEVKHLRELIDERMKFCVAEISVISQKERFKQCPKCKGDSEMQKYVLTEKGRALSQRPSTFYGPLGQNITDGSSLMSPDEGEKSPECKFLTMSEPDFTKIIWRRQERRFKQLLEQ